MTRFLELPICRGNRVEGSGKEAIDEEEEPEERVRVESCGPSPVLRQETIGEGVRRREGEEANGEGEC